MADPQIAVLLGLLLAIPLVALARRVDVPYPIVLVLGGLALGFIPGLPPVRLEPNLVLLIFLPPLLYWEALTAPTDVMLANSVQIGMLAIGLVLATTVAVAVAVHAIVPEMPWAVAFVLGAIVAPTDELASAPILERFRLPRHLIAIVDGESLVNDALSLVLYAAAVTAATTGTFHLGKTVLYVVFAAAGAVVLGLLVGRVAVEGWRRIADAQLQGVISVLLPFFAYLPADRFGMSGVLSVVTAGVYASRETPTVLTPATRLLGFGFWQSFVFLANAVLFLLLGLQLREISMAVFQHNSWQSVVWYTIVVNVVVIVARFAWIIATEFVPTVGGASEHPEPNVKHATIAAWSGFRGAVSLAAALAIPTALASGAPFPHRDLVVFLTFSVIVVTLVGGGFTLPVAIRALNVRDERDEEAAELQRALVGVAEAALTAIDELERDGRLDAHHATTLRFRYERKRRLAGDDASAGELDDERRDADAERAVLAAERAALVELRRKGEIDNTVLRRVQRALDLADQRLRR
jgi:CPA1 family monovalent cation:H+ antiporter